MPGKDLMICDSCKSVEVFPYLTAEDNDWLVGKTVALCPSCRAEKLDIDIFPCMICDFEAIGTGFKDAGLFQVGKHWICEECCIAKKMSAAEYKEDTGRGWPW